MAQQESNDYATIGNYPLTFSVGNSLARMIDGLGYRYFWASDSLGPADLAYIPSDGARTSFETIEHIYDLSCDIMFVAKSNTLARPRAKYAFTYEELRLKTLENLKLASEAFAALSDEACAERNVVFKKSNGESIEYPLWNLINGQISDAIYHTGQLVSFRRSSGNPVSKTMNVFTGGM